MNKLTYRPNVSMIVFRSDGKVLVNHEKGKREEKWKFPQGGVENGETLEQAVKRELKEEVNVTHYSILAQAKYVREYEWPEDTQKRKGFRGQKQHSFLIYSEKPEEAKPNENVIIETKWLPFHEAVEKFNFENQQNAAWKVWEEFASVIEKRVKEIGTFTRSAFRPTVQMWAFNSKKEILLVNETDRINLKRKKMNQETLPEYWLIPQGGIKWRIHEKAEDAARRELEEETNVKTIQLVHVSPQKHSVEHQFIVKGYEGGAEVTPVLVYCPKPREAKFNPDENQEIKWVPLEKVVEKLTIENQKESAKKTMKIFAPLIQKFSAK